PSLAMCLCKCRCSLWRDGPSVPHWSGGSTGLWSNGTSSASRASHLRYSRCCSGWCPRSVDSAIEYTGYEVFKFVSLPCAGAALALSFPRTLGVLAAAIKANLVSTLGVLVRLYTAAPVRLRNSYLGSDQKMLGAGMALLAGALAIYWGLGLLFGS